MGRKKINQYNYFEADGKSPLSWEIRDEGTEGVSLYFSKHGFNLLPDQAEELATDLLKAAAANRITYREETEHEDADG